MLGVILIDKPKGISSHDVVDELRRRFSMRKVGHAGTLDPLATGLLVLAVGPATRFLQYLPLEPKVYRAQVTFGVQTNTFDAEGEIVETLPVPEDLQAKVARATPPFLGVIEQVPPMFSAVKQKGRPLYELARRGESVQRDPRRVHIGRFELERLEGNVADFMVECSGGTYVRTLASELGLAVGCGAHLSGLVRLAAGRFSLADAVALDEASPSHVAPLADALGHMPPLNLSPSEARSIRQGRRLPGRGSGELFALLAPGEGVIGVARKTAEGDLQPECVIPEEALIAEA